MFCYIYYVNKFQTVMETRKAVQQISSCKASSADEIPVEVYKTWGATHGRDAEKVGHCMWRKEAGCIHNTPTQVKSVTTT